MNYCILLCCILASCSKAKDPLEPKNPSDEVVSDYHTTSDLLTTAHIIGGFGVVSMLPDHALQHSGEALIWGGTALWSLGCDAGAGISSAMRQMIMDHEGALIRVAPLGEYENGREVTVDGALGLLLGVSRRITDCGEAEAWRAPMDAMIKFQDSHQGKLNANVDSTLFADLKYLRNVIGFKTGALASEAGQFSLKGMEALVGDWSLAVQLAHQTGKGSDACYRVNLGLSALLAAETLGFKISDDGRNQFCQNTIGMDIPTADHWCGRSHLADAYLPTYEIDTWEFRHQRCGSWEQPDGHGNISPRLDKLEAMAMAYGWQALQR